MLINKLNIYKMKEFLIHHSHHMKIHQKLCLWVVNYFSFVNFYFVFIVIIPYYFQNPLKILYIYHKKYYIFTPKNISFLLNLYMIYFKSKLRIVKHIMY